MDYRVDEKGKVFTTHVTKRTVPVMAQVGNTIVQGVVYLTLDNRLKDELNNGEQFIAITDAQVREISTDRLLCQTPALIVNKQEIVWILPRESNPPATDSDSAAR